jgi:hypothetical protein
MVRRETGHVFSGVDCPDISKYFTIRSPRSSNNVELSIPHRLLAILMTRGLLRDYEATKDDVHRLINGIESTIRIKQEASDLPVFLRANPRGFGLTSYPMRSEALSQYLKSKARQVGLVTNTDSLDFSIYAWRRAASNKMEDAKGLDATRTLMHHDAGSSTYINHYARGPERFDLFAIATGEEEESILDSAALRRIERRTIDRVAFLGVKAMPPEQSFWRSTISQRRTWNLQGSAQKQVTHQWSRQRNLRASRAGCLDDQSRKSRFPKGLGHRHILFLTSIMSLKYFVEGWH